MQMTSAEKLEDRQKANEISLANTVDQSLRKKLKEENKRLCREFWQEQMVLRQKHRALRGFI